MTRQVSETVQHEVFTPGDADAHGNRAEAWADPVDVDVYGFDPGGSTEPALPGYNRIITTPTLFAPKSAVFGGRDRVTVRGLLYEVDGDTSEWRHPRGRRPGNVVNLKRVTG